MEKLGSGLLVLSVIRRRRVRLGLRPLRRISHLILLLTLLFLEDLLV